MYLIITVSNKDRWYEFTVVEFSGQNENTTKGNQIYFHKVYENTYQSFFSSIRVLSTS